MEDGRLGVRRQRALAALEANRVPCRISAGVAAGGEVTARLCSALVGPHLEHHPPGDAVRRHGLRWQRGTRGTTRGRTSPLGGAARTSGRQGALWRSLRSPEAAEGRRRRRTMAEQLRADGVHKEVLREGTGPLPDFRDGTKVSAGPRGGRGRGRRACAGAEPVAMVTRGLHSGHLPLPDAAVRTRGGGAGRQPGAGQTHGADRREEVQAARVGGDTAHHAARRARPLPLRAQGAAGRGGALAGGVVSPGRGRGLADCGRGSQRGAGLARPCGSAERRGLSVGGTARRWAVWFGAAGDAVRARGAGFYHGGVA